VPARPSGRWLTSPAHSPCRAFPPTLLALRCVPRATKRVTHPLDDVRTCDGNSTRSQPDWIRVIADQLNQSFLSVLPASRSDEQADPDEQAELDASTFRHPRPYRNALHW